MPGVALHALSVEGCFCDFPIIPLRSLIQTVMMVLVSFVRSTSFAHSDRVA
jgi:hypothetical protein